MGYRVGAILDLPIVMTGSRQGFLRLVFGLIHVHAFGMLDTRAPIISIQFPQPDIAVTDGVTVVL